MSLAYGVTSVYRAASLLSAGKQKHVLASERASERRSRVRGRGPFFRAPRTRVSFRLRLSRDFSRLSRMESLLAGITQAFIYSSSSSFKQTVVYLCSI